MQVRLKAETIASGMRDLVEAWHARNELYEHNVECERLVRELRALDAWLCAQDALVHHTEHLLGGGHESVEGVEALLKRHDDLESTLAAMRPRFELISRESRPEKALRELREREAASRRQAHAQLQIERRREAERKKRLEQRRVDERRRTQEIIAIVGQQQQPQSTSSLMSIAVDSMVIDSESSTAVQSLSQVRLFYSELLNLQFIGES